MSVVNPALSERSWRRIPRAVWALGLTSLFMDASSEAIHSVLPVFIVQVLGASPSILGLLEGGAEGITAFTKLFSGVLSDRLRSRKAITIAGYSLAAVSKPLFALAPTVAWVAVARFTDRIGKGVRGSPRDALVADLTPKEVQGAAFGLRQALDTIGAILGPLLALALMVWLGLGLRAVFWLAAIPAALSVTVLALGVHEPERTALSGRKPWPWQGGGRLPAAFWSATAIGAALTMARFSEAFLVLRAHDLGLATELLPLVLITENVVYAIVSYPAGAASDQISPQGLLAASLVVLAGADIVLANAVSLPMALAGVALSGFHMGLSQGVLSAMVGLAAPPVLRATAFGTFNLVMGVATIASSAIAGILWQDIGPETTFLFGAGFSGIALLGTITVMRGGRDKSSP